MSIQLNFEIEPLLSSNPTIYEAFEFPKVTLLREVNESLMAHYLTGAGGTFYLKNLTETGSESIRLLDLNKTLKENGIREGDLLLKRNPLAVQVIIESPPDDAGLEIPINLELQKREDLQREVLDGLNSFGFTHLNPEMMIFKRKSSETKQDIPLEDISSIVDGDILYYQRMTFNDLLKTISIVSFDDNAEIEITRQVKESSSVSYNFAPNSFLRIKLNEALIKAQGISNNTIRFIINSTEVNFHEIHETAFMESPYVIELFFPHECFKSYTLQVYLNDLPSMECTFFVPLPKEIQLNKSTLEGGNSKEHTLSNLFTPFILLE